MSGRGKRRSKNLSPKPSGRLEQRLDVVSQHFEGPLPPPEALKQYQAIYPMAVEWIFEQASQQGEHRRRIERRIVNWGTFNELLGVVSASLIGVGAIGGGIWLISIDKDAGGLTSIIAALSSLVIVYRTGRKKQ